MSMIRSNGALDTALSAATPETGSGGAGEVESRGLADQPGYSFAAEFDCGLQLILDGIERDLSVERGNGDVSGAGQSHGRSA
jgi:hypothetical protein